MHLDRLKLRNFKNYEEIDLEFSGAWISFLGPNGGGKTNLLDAIHYLCLCKSYFQHTDNVNIRHGTDGFLIEGKLGEATVKCTVAIGKKKSFFLNNNKYPKLSEHIGRFPVVVIAPDDMEIINGGSEARRKLLDSNLAQLDAGYLKNLQLYNKVLTQRNGSLREFAQRNTYDESLLDSWDEQLIPLGKKIHQHRLELMDDFVPLFEKQYQSIAGKQEVPRANYVSELSNTDFAQLLKNSREKDKFLARTVSGIHRDDLELVLSGHAVKRFGSQGQRKTFLIALKLAMYELIRQKKQIAPILLLDDLFDKLDRSRVQKLLEVIATGDFGQVFLTDTHQKRVNELFSELPIELSKFIIKDGRLV